MIVVADLEGTLTAGWTWRAMGRHHRSERSALTYNLFFASQMPAYALTNLGLADRQNFRNRWLRRTLQMIKATSMDEVIELCEWIVEDELWPKRRHDILTEFELHRNSNARIIVASGTFKPIVDAFARRISAEAIGTAIGLVNGFVDTLDSGNVRQRKADAVRALIGGQSVTIAYGDTASDIPLLEMAEHPVAVHPDATLKKAAQERGWRIHEDLHPGAPGNVVVTHDE